MPQLTIVNRNGQETLVEASTDLTVMEAMRDAGVEGLLALCGGCCSCATCHVYFEDDVIAQLREMTEDENDLLDSSDHRRATSRLSCQITISKELAGARITLAPED